MLVIAKNDAEDNFETFVTFHGSEIETRRRAAKLLRGFIDAGVVDAGGLQ